MPNPEHDGRAWLRQIQPDPRHRHQPETLGALQLAWLGDAVWELHQRLRHCHQAGRPDELHQAVVARVRAQAQAQALQCLEPLLDERERELVRRGRNRAGRGPRGGDPASYGRATGFETMVGWLFLRNPERLAQLLDHLDETDLSDPLPSDP
ncbi:Mini-ribonuclease 3 [Synechococcus sp. CBW1107]|nr:Mini-ribonuclease 3 [Synechococcus sp. CBW1107]